jgi:hypothetical protein
MRPGQIVARCWALVFLGLAIWREIVWHRRLRSWRQVDGIVDDFLAFDSASLPVVRFEVDGMKRTLVSSFCLWNPQLGESVAVFRKWILCALLAPLLAGCVAAPDGGGERFEAAPSSIDARLDTATIEEYIIALPAFAYHEESVEQFAEHVRRARTEESKNRGKGSDELFVGGDGCWPPKNFVLDRGRRTLTIRIFQWEPGMKDSTETMRRVLGGWMRGPHVGECDAAAQADRSNDFKTRSRRGH